MDVRILPLIHVFICSTESNVEIDGEVSFDIQILKNRGRSITDINETYSSDVIRQNSFGGDEGVGKVTVGAVVECEYQFPEQQQMETLLSDMMNHLAQIFVRTKEFDQIEENHWVKRFRVVGKQGSGNLEMVFKNMTQEYKEFYEATLNKLDRTGDPCLQQPRIKRAWKALLSKSQSMLRRAALAGVELVHRADDSSARRRLEVMVTRLVADARSQQLDALCDRFQLCYDELLQE